MSKQNQPQSVEGWEKEFVEKGADLEHDRWARWQKYFFSKCTWHWLTEIVRGNTTLTLPEELHSRWLRQIDTPYSELSEQEKESDRKETRNYLPLIRQLLTHQQSEVLEKIKKIIIDEINIAHKEGQPTSRLTSAYNLISSLYNNKS